MIYGVIKAATFDTCTHTRDTLLVSVGDTLLARVGLPRAHSNHDFYCCQLSSQQCDGQTGCVHMHGTHCLPEWGSLELTPILTSTAVISAV